MTQARPSPPKCSGKTDVIAIDDYYNHDILTLHTFSFVLPLLYHTTMFMIDGVRFVDTACV